MIGSSTVDPWAMKINEMEKRITALESDVKSLKEKLTYHNPVQKRKRLDSMSFDLASDSNLQ